MPKAGDRIAQVRLSRPLAEGGMGQIWVGEHLERRVDVAVKLVDERHLDPEAVQRFEREAATIAEVASPHVVRMFEHGRTPSGLPYMVMELLSGESLAARLARQRRVAPGELGTIVAHAARALTSMHAASIIHRDIKPSNLFLSPTDDGPWCTVIDFGVAKRLGGSDSASLTADGHLVGTPHYMSPEQLLHGSDKLTPHVDLWSLAVVAYQCLAGALPFRAERLGDLSIAIFGSTYVPISELRPDLSAAFDAFFARAFRKKLSARFPTADELAAAFAELVGEVEDDDVATVPIRAFRGERDIE
jgi:eukaryotic-like serine/threonine-protein kinase